ncbi:hypothetical protein M2408_003591 [Sphingobacterium sp. BIGb0165]|nr:hypothetical protein [Sphingobacterium sp. BIGb0165]
MPQYNFIIDFGKYRWYRSGQIVVDLLAVTAQIKRIEKVPLVVYTLVLLSFTTMILNNSALGDCK